MPKAWGRVSRAEMDVRPGGIFSIDIAVADGREVPNLGCFLDVVPMERLVWTSMLFPGYRPAVFDDIPITAIITMETVGTGTRYVFTALHRNEADLEKTKRRAFTGHRDRRRSVRGPNATHPACQWKKSQVQSAFSTNWSVYSAMAGPLRGQPHARTTSHAARAMST
jgi:uncharacterized protein YndB with AHSA1/START domain